MSSDTYNPSSVLKLAFEELERARFVKTAKNEIATRVSGQGGVGLLEGVQYDDLHVTYPTSTTEEYAFYLGGVLQRTIQQFHLGS
jgi:hypothetical protein